MDTRKDYVAPAIAAEDVLEQTSLACNMSQLVLNNPEVCPTQPEYSKGGGWDVIWWQCASPVLDADPVCFPALQGVVLS